MDERSRRRRDEGVEIGELSRENNAREDSKGKNEYAVSLEEASNKFAYPHVVIIALSWAQVRVLHSRPVISWESEHRRKNGLNVLRHQYSLLVHTLRRVWG